MKYWLMKSEPDVFSIDDLSKQPNQKSHWDGVRNYQARNFMRDEMDVGDKVLFYHSNCKVPGIVGIATVASSSYPDHTSWDKKSEYFDPKSGPDNPRWFMVDVKFEEKFSRTVSLNEMKEVKALAEMLILRKGNRLSITPVQKKEFQTVLDLGREA